MAWGQTHCQCCYRCCWCGAALQCGAPADHVGGEEDDDEVTAGLLQHDADTTEAEADAASKEALLTQLERGAGAPDGAVGLLTH